MMGNLSRGLFNELVGWLGMLLLLGAFALSNFGVTTVNDLSYQLMNLFGAAGIAYISWLKANYQPAALNIVWVLVALFGLGKLFYA